MQNAVYNNKCILAIDIIYPHVEDYKEISKKSLLKCPCCKNTVILKYGKKNIPHFSHKENNPNCILCKQKKEVLKIIEEAQLDFIMRIREIYKDEFISINLNAIKDNELIHIQVTFNNKSLLNIRFIENLNQKLLDDCLNIIVFKGQNMNISKDEIFKYLIKYNVTNKTFLRGFYDMKNNKTIKYFCEMEKFLIINKKVDYSKI